MKYIKIIILLCCPFWIMGQCGETAEGYSTDPTNAVNPDPNCSTINTFDWRTPKWYAPYYMERESDDHVPSPFFNANNRAIPEIYETGNHNGKDFEVEDGWELIMDGITKQQGNEEEVSIIYLALYNKFTATLRIFGAHYNIGNGAGEYDYAIIKLYFSHHQRGLLHPTQQIAQPLDEKSITKVQRNANLQDVNPVQFFYADFPMGYDPCTCFSTDLAQLEVEFEAVDDREIYLYGRSVSISTTLEQIAGKNSLISDDFLTNVYSSNGIKPEAGVQTFTTLSNLEDHYKDLKNQANKLKEQYDAVKDLKTALDVAATLVAVAAAIPSGGSSLVAKLAISEKKAKIITSSLKATGKFTDVLSGSLKARKDAAVGAADAVGNTRIISSEMVFSGNIQNTADRGGFSFYLPGQPQNSTKCTHPYYPMYNEVLGRFAVLETPKVKIGTDEIDGGYPGVDRVRQSYNFDASSFKYMFNPAAKVDEANTLIYGAIVVKKPTISAPHSQVLTNLSKVNSLTEDDTTVYITPFLPIDCLGSLGNMFDHHGYASSLAKVNYEIQLKLIIIYTFDQIGSDGNFVQTYEILTYPVEPVIQSFSAITPLTLNSDGSTIQEVMTLGTNNYTSNQTIFAWEKIIINGDLSVSSGVQVVLSAPEIIIQSGATIGEGITLEEREVPFTSCTPINPFDATGLSSYCGNESTYKANQNKNPRLVEPPIVDDKPIKPIPLQSTPNPFTNTFNIEFELESESTTSLMVFDALGRVVETVVVDANLGLGKHQYQIDGSRLQSGIYYVKLQTDNGTQTIKIIKQ